MKTIKLVSVRLISIAVIAAALNACGNNNANNAGIAGTPGAQTGLGTYPGGCVPVQGGTLGFTAVNAAFNGNAYILAGTLPQNSTHPGVYGQVTMGGGATTATATAASVQFQPKVSSSGTLQITTVPQSGQMSGVVQLSQSITYQLMAMSGYGAGAYPYGTPYNTIAPTNPATTTSQMCVNSMAFDIVETTTYNGQSTYGTGYTGVSTYPGATLNTGYINQALVYLTLNNGQVVGPIAFY